MVKVGYHANLLMASGNLLCQLVERYYPEFKDALREQGKQFPKFVEREFDEFLRCGRLEHGFLRVVCGDCKHEKLVAFGCKRRGFYPSCGAKSQPTRTCNHW